jgi:hypothetical protein
LLGWANHRCYDGIGIQLERGSRYIYIILVEKEAGHLEDHEED